MNEPPPAVERRIWTVAGQPSAAAFEALHLLRSSADEGLSPEDYGADSLTLLADATAAVHGARGGAAALEAGLTVAVAAYLRDLHQGRVDPRDVGLRLEVPDDEHDFAALVREAAGANRVAALVEAYRPSPPQYDALRRELRRYRRVRDDTVPLPTAGRSVHPGEPYADVAALARRLARLGDLTEDASPGLADRHTSRAGTLYDTALADAVRRFQGRHGLEADGVLGTATIAALNVPVSWRTRQIELALERLRWLPHPTRPRVLVLNIPMFQLWGWRPGVDAAPTFSTRVIVGKALRTATPVMAREMREVIFRPYWNVPRSILRAEVLPIVQRDPGYLQRQNMELVAGERDDDPVVEASPENLEGLRRGQLRLRQRPGAGNALGLVKFVFPNDEQVYMHGTPAPSLFNRSRRDFSHGCVRVQDPVGLAVWVLSEQAGWPRERVVAAMAASRPEPVRLETPIQVLLFYTTSAVLPDGTLHFADDIYGHDARLDRALRSRTMSE